VVRKACDAEGGSAWGVEPPGLAQLLQGRHRRGDRGFKVDRSISAPPDFARIKSMVGIGCADFDVGRQAEAAARWTERALLEHSLGGMDL